MKKNFDIKWDEFVNKMKYEKRKIILFGASSCADVFLNKTNQRFDVKYIIDNDVNKQGKEFFGYEVYPIEKLGGQSENELLVITSTWCEDIAIQLEKFGYNGEVYSYLHMQNKVLSQQIEEESSQLNENIRKLIELCYDEKSKNIINKIIYKLKHNIVDFSDLYEKNQYFIPNIINLDENEVFIDGGAYDGKTVDEFISFCDGNFKKVYSFEMDRENYIKIPRGKYDNRVEFLNYGLWNQAETVSFVEKNNSSEIASYGSNSAQCIALDDIIKEKVTFIKMDIEGAELKALEGAKNIIKRDQPKLAICLYHKLSDLWNIPFYIHDLVPEYKLYVRHHGKNQEETVLYAVK